jgi:ABC-2 type transport system permease protein
MAVYKRTYTAYEGDLTPNATRFLILPRAHAATINTKPQQTRLLLFLRLAALIYPLGLLVYIYLANNFSVFESLGIQAGRFVEVTPTTFLYFCWIQGIFAYLMTTLIGPGLVSPDLVNNALPLYLSRPFSRTEYVLGKMSVLVGMLSLATWVPGLFVFAVQASLAGWDWTKDNAWIAVSLTVGLGIWVVLLSLIALAVSAFVKWRIAAGAVLLAIFVAGAGFGAALNQVVRTEYGSLLNLTLVMYTIWTQLFGQVPDSEMTVTQAWSVVAIVCALCVWLLARKIRAFEVVK